jgi:hypothetical protein
MLVDHQPSHANVRETRGVASQYLLVALGTNPPGKLGLSHKPIHVEVALDSYLG